MLIRQRPTSWFRKRYDKSWIDLLNFTFNLSYQIFSFLHTVHHEDRYRNNMQERRKKSHNKSQSKKMRKKRVNGKNYTRPSNSSYGFHKRFQSKLMHDFQKLHNRNQYHTFVLYELSKSQKCALTSRECRRRNENIRKHNESESVDTHTHRTIMQENWDRRKSESIIYTRENANNGRFFPPKFKNLDYLCLTLVHAWVEWERWKEWGFQCELSTIAT